MHVRGGVLRRNLVSAGTLVGALACVVGVVACTLPNSGPTPTPRVPTDNPRAAAALTPAPGVSGNPEVGRQLFTDAKVFPTNGCATCHTLSAAGSTGTIGPNLNNVTLRSTLGGGAVPTTADNLARWIMNAGAMKPGAAMPAITALTEQQARDIAAYLYSLPYNPR